MPPPEGPMIAATSPRSTDRLTPRRTSTAPCRLQQVVDFDHASAPPFTPALARRRSDHRENHESGTLISM